jgi:hypothetical protein
LTVTAYRSKANAICAKERQQTMTRYMNSTTLVQYLNAEVPVVQSAFASLKKLEPPTLFASVHALILATVRSELELFTLFQQEVAVGKLTLAEWKADPQLGRLDSRELALWKKVGARICST